MSPVGPVPHLPPIPMPAGVLPAGHERRNRDDGRGKTGEEESAPAEDAPRSAGAGDQPEPEMDLGRVVDLKA